jgi:hypothetical protein
MDGGPHAKYPILTKNYFSPQILVKPGNVKSHENPFQREPCCTMLLDGQNDRQTGRQAGRQADRSEEANNRFLQLYEGILKPAGNGCFGRKDEISAERNTPGAFQ